MRQRYHQGTRELGFELLGDLVGASTSDRIQQAITVFVATMMGGDDVMMDLGS